MNPSLDSFMASHTAHVQVWFEDAQGEGFGSGRVRLLQLIDELGSLSQAAKALGMSYRGAWGKLKKAEMIMGVSLVESVGTKREGFRLTPDGHELVRLFGQWAHEVDDFAKARAQVLFVASS